MTKTLKAILTLFSRGLESAAVSDAVFGETLKCVTKLLPLATLPEADVPSPAQQGGIGKPPRVPLAALAELMEKAVARAARPSRTLKSEAENRGVSDALERVFAKAPSSWRETFSIEAAAAATAATVGAARDGRPPRASHSASTKGPKRRASHSLDAKSGGPVAVKKSRS